MSLKRTSCLFVSDLHGKVDRYNKLFQAVANRRPAGVFLGGDLLPAWPMFQSADEAAPVDFIQDFLARGFENLRRQLQKDYPEVFVILGNDDPRIEEVALLELEGSGLWKYAHQKTIPFRDHRVIGYAFVPPTPFTLKDWERYDVSRYIDPGSVSPEEGIRTVPIPESETRYATIREDLDELAASGTLDQTVCLFHSPPYETRLDRVSLDGEQIDHVPLDVHVGSIAMRRFIEERQPRLTLHGHVHESARLTGSWRDRIGRSHLFSAAHDGPELALVSFDLEDLEGATRELL